MPTGIETRRIERGDRARDITGIDPWSWCDGASCAGPSAHPPQYFCQQHDHYVAAESLIDITGGPHTSHHTRFHGMPVITSCAEADDWDDDPEPEEPCDCSTCRRERRGGDSPDIINSYSYVPRELPFIGTETLVVQTHGNYPEAPSSDPYLGLEVETEAVRGERDDVARVWADSGLGWCATDGSLSYAGVECKTYPMTYARLAESNLAATIDAMRARGARAWQPGTCGLHIHVSVAAFTGKPHLWRFAAAHEKLSPTLRKLAGRHSTEWAQWADDMGDSGAYPGRGCGYYFAEGHHAYASSCENCRGHGMAPRPPSTSTKIVAGKAHPYTRYMAVHVEPGTSTVELRYWRGSMWPGTVLGAAALEDAFLNWTRRMTFAQVRESLTWKAFTAYAVENLPDTQVEHIATLAARRSVGLHFLPGPRRLDREPVEVC